MSSSRISHTILASLFVLLVIGLTIAGGAGFKWNGGGSPVSNPEAPSAAPETRETTADPIHQVFRDVSNSTGLTYTFDNQGKVAHGGVYVTDFNNDYRSDVLAIGGEQPALFRNDGGSFVRVRNFSIAAKAALFFDYDNDGWADLLLLSPDTTPTLFENQNGTFTRQEVGLTTNLTYPIGATTADYNGDGCLDLYIIQYADWDAKRPAGKSKRLSPGETDNGNRNHLFRGDCSSFTEAKDAGIEGAQWTLAASFVDLTGDDRPDIHVANDFNNDLIYVNNGDDAFDRVVLSPETDRNAMSSEVVDVNTDGRSDIFVTNIYFPDEFSNTDISFLNRTKGNNLLINQRGEGFSDSAEEYGVRIGGWGWAATIADFDNDGDQDLFHTTSSLQLPGAVYKELQKQKLVTPDQYILEHPYLRWPVYRERVGQSFKKRNASQLGFEIANGRGVSRLDFDQDGDLDLVVAQQSGRLKLYENTMRTGNWLRVIVAGNETVPATGAQLRVSTENGAAIRTNNAKADFLSQESRISHIGVGSAQRITTIRVIWPDGTERAVRNIEANQVIRITPAGNVSYP